jgi:hypothetical protein
MVLLNISTYGKPATSISSPSSRSSEPSLTSLDHLLVFGLEVYVVSGRGQGWHVEHVVEIYFAPKIETRPLRVARRVASSVKTFRDSISQKGGDDHFHHGLGRVVGGFVLRTEKHVPR